MHFLSPHVLNVHPQHNFYGLTVIIITKLQGFGMYLIILNQVFFFAFHTKTDAAPRADNI